MAERSLLEMYTRPVKKAEREIVGRDLEIQRVQAALMRPELCNVMLLGEAGSGKALANHTPIPVADSRGYVRIMDLRPGDYVYDESGHSTRVLGVYPQGALPAYLVKFSDGSEMICNDEHLWNVRSRADRYRKSGYETMTLREIMNKGIKPRDWWLPVAKPALRAKYHFAVEPYVVGAVLALNLYMDASLRAASDYDDGFLVKLSRLIGPMYLHRRTKDGKSQMWQYMRPNSCLFDYMQRTRRIPPKYFIGSVSQRFELLQGMMDACGYVSDTSAVNCILTLDDELLAADAVRMANSVGLRCKMDSAGDNKYTVEFLSKYLTKYRLVSREDLVSNLAIYQTKHVKRARRFDDIFIESVEPLNRKMGMTCIYVEADSHLFQAGYNHIVTHNTALVQGTMLRDSGRRYLEVDLSKMIANAKDGNEMGAMLKMLFDEVADSVKTDGSEIVLFIDEFHQIVQLSESAVEALKPLLADGGTRGVRVIAATTYIEFRKWISPNQPLVERLQRINLPEPPKKVVMSILQGMAERYDVARLMRDNNLFELIYEYTNRYIPANAQPRKSLLILDAMIGWHRASGREFNTQLLADVIYESEGVNVSFSINAAKIREALDERVLSQKFATRMIESRLQICAADLNNKKRPMSSFLFSGSTGVGKSLLDDEPIPVYQPSVRNYRRIPVKKNGELLPGDYVFNRFGEPARVAAVFPQGMQDVYELELIDGRKIKCSGDHLWGYKVRQGNKHWLTGTTKGLMEILEATRGSKSGVFIPMNKPAAHPKKDFPIHPYLMGILINAGCLTSQQLAIATKDEFIAETCCKLLKMPRYDHKSPSSTSWVFATGDMIGGKFFCRLSTETALAAFPELVGKKKHERAIPECYFYGSVEQRWELVRGLFDTKGYISRDDERYTITYWHSSLEHMHAVRRLLWSLGVSSTLVTRAKRQDRPAHYRAEHKLSIRADNLQKPDFFKLPRKKAVASEAVRYYKNQKIRKLRYNDYIQVVDIRKLDYQAPMTCIYVDDEEHLFQTGNYIITHNTEVSKALAGLLFGDESAMIRMDMTEYANKESLERFRNELTNRVWARPFSIVLLDEIEKACSEVTRLLLQVLDDGRLMDENNRIVSFLNCYIIMTTNAGNEIYKVIAQYNADDEGSGDDIMRYNKLIRSSIVGTSGDNKFPPELLGRIDCLVPFQPLSEATQKAIAAMNLRKFRANVWQIHRVNLGISKDVVRYLVEDNLDTDSDSGGARIIMSKMESDVIIPVAKYINEHPGVQVLYVGVEGKLVRDDVTLRVGTARIKVQETPFQKAG